MKLILRHVHLCINVETCFGQFGPEWKLISIKLNLNLVGWLDGWSNG